MGQSVRSPRKIRLEVFTPYRDFRNDGVDRHELSSVRDVEDPSPDDMAFMAGSIARRLYSAAGSSANIGALASPEHGGNRRSVSHWSCAGCSAAYSQCREARF